MAKSGKGQSAGTAGAKIATKDTGKELARLEKRLQKARDVEAKRKKQASEARAEVAQLAARIRELKPASDARSATAPSSSPGASPTRSKGRAKPAAVKPAATTAAAPKPTVAATATATRRKAAPAPATRSSRTRKTVPADGSGDGTGPT